MIDAKHRTEVNPHAMDAFVKASESYSIVASRDIVDVGGLKLWGKGQPVSATLHQRLLDRKLREPIEACLMAEDGVTAVRLYDELSALLDSDEPITQLIKPYAAVLLDQVKLLPIHPVVQLLLTSALATRPSTLPHAVAAMALAGAMARRERSAGIDVRLAMLGGLLHDVGEVYINPEYLDYSAALGIVGHKHLMVHPRMAQVLLQSMTDYPPSLCRAIGEHHERLDGSGYPARLGAKDISEFGAMLAVVEATLGILRAPHAPLHRASFAMRIVPGEFSLLWIGLICNTANAGDVHDLSTDPSAINLGLGSMTQIETHLAHAQQLKASLISQGRGKEALDIVDAALHRLMRLKVAWNALGLWGVDASDLSDKEQFYVGMVSKELQLRIRQLQRECLLLSERLGELERTSLQSLWAGLLEG
jgi:hypothetical protein